jgi:hypothetical protein
MDDIRTHAADVGIVRHLHRLVYYRSVPSTLCPIEEPELEIRVPTAVLDRPAHVIRKSGDLIALRGTLSVSNLADLFSKFV